MSTSRVLAWFRVLVATTCVVLLLQVVVTTDSFPSSASSAEDDPICVSLNGAIQCWLNNQWRPFDAVAWPSVVSTPITSNISPAAVVIYGTVYYSTRPLSGIRVELIPGSGSNPPIASTTTNSSGAYSFSNISPGTYWVRAYGPTSEYVTWLESYTPVQTQNVRKDIYLPKILGFSPASGSTLNISRPTFCWQSLPEATHYLFGMNRTDASDTAPPIDQADVTATCYTTSKTLLNGVQYDWLVHALDASFHVIGVGGGLFSVKLPPIILVHGWHGLNAFTWSSCSTGATFYSGSIDQNAPTDFDPIPLWLENDFNVWIAHLDTGLFSTPPIEQNARCLQNQIDFVYNHPTNNHQKIILIAHSMGGLVSRAALEANPDQDHHVSMLITLGTPHLGILATPEAVSLVGCLGDIAACQFGPIYMNLIFNPQHSQRNVPTYVVGGLMQNIALRFDQGTGDGIIPVQSATGLSDSARYVTSETHAQPPFGYPTYMQLASSDTTDQGISFRCVIHPLLYGSGQPPGCVVGPLSVQQPSDVSMAIVDSPFISNTASLGQTITHSVTVDSSNRSSFTASWLTGTLNFNLIAPTGQVITPGYAQANPALVLYSTAPISSPFGAMASYGLTTTIPGTWTLQVSNPGPVSPVDYHAQVSFESPLTVTAQAAHEVYPVGSTVQLSAVISSSTPISMVQGSATVFLPGGATTAVLLTVVSTQTLTGSFVVPQIPGGYTFAQVLVSGLANGQPFTRQAGAEFLVPTNGAKLAGSYADRLSDPAGVLYRTLSFDARISVTTPATYTLSADLTTGSQVIAHSQASGVLSAGAPTMTIQFSGDAIRAGQLNGPYMVSSVVLVDSSSYSLWADSADNVWTTAAYNYTQFGTPRLFLPLIANNP